MKELLEKIEAIMKPHPVYAVGGCVRDYLLGIEPKDYDFCTPATPSEIEKCIKSKSLRAYLIGKKFGTIGCKVDGQMIEITTFRSEEYQPGYRKPAVKFVTNLTEDLSRRDFTINAMAIKVKNPDLKTENYEVEIVDPYEGKKDLEKKIIKAVGEAETRFEEDALRMMRAIRIGTELGFTLEEKTFEAISKKNSLINEIAKERVRDELLKILKSDFPKEGILMLYNSGLLEHIMPELLDTRNVQQAGHHTKDVWSHSIDALEGCSSKDPIVRLATLLHDIAKPKVKMDRGKGKEITFYNHEVAGGRMVKVIARRLKMSKKNIDMLWLLVRWHMFAYDPKMTDKAIRRFIKRVGLENIEKMMMLRTGDRIGGGSKPTSWRLEELKKRIKEVLYTPMQIKDLKVNGNDVMKILKIKGGPKVGKVLEKLFDEVMDDAKKNKREYLLKRVEKIS